ncbi:MAG: hypothetical protein AB7Q29_12845 [Vicinamibacterales bacterium]
MLTLTARLTLALALAACVATPAQAQLKSAELAKELTAALSTRQLDAFAAQDPAADNAFVAALSFPGTQLLVIAARHTETTYLLRSIGVHNYRDVYTALQGTTINEGRLFVQDMGADGLRTQPEQQVDIIYERGKDQTVLNGDVRNKKYQSSLQRLDAEYAKALQALLDGVKKLPPATASVKP